MRSLVAMLLFCLTATVAHSKTRPVENTVPVFDRHAVHSIGSEAVITERAARKVRSAKQTRKGDRRNTGRRYAHKHRYAGHSAKLSDVTPVLAAKAAELISKCNAKVISAHRPGARVRGYGTLSLHARYPAEAVDMKGDKNCMYPLLKDWPGGYSTDYAAVQHLHISMASDRRERWARFSHYGTRRYARRR